MFGKLLWKLGWELGFNHSIPGKPKKNGGNPWGIYQKILLGQPQMGSCENSCENSCDCYRNIYYPLVNSHVDPENSIFSMELIVQSLSGRVYVNFLEGNHEQQPTKSCRVSKIGNELGFNGILPLGKTMGKCCWMLNWDSIGISSGEKSLFDGKSLGKLTKKHGWYGLIWCNIGKYCYRCPLISKLGTMI